MNKILTVRRKIGKDYEAIQYTGSNKRKIITLLRDCRTFVSENYNGSFYVRGEGKSNAIRVDKGDWIIADSGRPLVFNNEWFNKVWKIVKK